MFRAGIVELRLKIETKLDATLNCLNPADQALFALPVIGNHKIGELGNTLISQIARQQNIGIGNIEPATVNVFQKRGNLKLAAILCIGISAEYRRGIELGETEEVNRAVIRNQRCCPHVSYDRIVSDGVIGGLK